MRRVYLVLSTITVMVLSLALFYFLRPSVNSDGEKATLKILCAESLLFPLQRVETAFEETNTNVDVEIEGHGSIQVIRQVTELGSESDLLMIADYSLIPIMMYNTTMQNTNQSFADWYVRFASGSIVLAYTNSSRYASEVSSGNWYSVLARRDVRYGFPNPLIDALGYRTLITVQLAEFEYGNHRIFHDLVTTNFDPPINSIPMDSNYIITVPEVQQPKSDKLILRASSIELIPLLETGAIDYCFLYLSNAKQYGFAYIELPDSINLGDTQYQELYQQVQVTFEHQRFATIGLDREGEPIYYGLTIPENALHPELAVEFIEFILNGEGEEIFESCFHPILTPPLTDNLKTLPEGLQSLVEKEPAS